MLRPTLYIPPLSLPLSWNESPDFTSMGQVPSLAESSVKSPAFPHYHFSSPATTFLAPQVSFITALYLNVVNGWIIFYLGQSFQFSVPWEQCPLLKNSTGFGEEEVKEKEKGETEWWKGIWKRRKA